MKLGKKVIAIFILILLFGTINFVFSESYLPEIVTQFGHRSAILKVVYSPDNKKVLSYDFDYLIKLWDIESREEINTYMGNYSLISSLYFSPDGNYFLSGAYDGTVCLWDIKETRAVKIFNDQKTRILVSFFSLDGKRIISFSEDGSFIEWDIEKGQISRGFNKLYKDAITAAVSPDKKFVVISFLNKEREVMLWDLEKQKLVKTFTVNNEIVNNLIFLSDGRRVLLGTWEGSTKLYDVFNGNELISFPDNYKYVTAFAVTNDQNTVIISSFSLLGSYFTEKTSQTKINIWDISSGNRAFLKKEITESFTGIMYGIYFRILAILSISVSNDNVFFITGNFDNSINLFDLEKYKFVKNINQKNIIHSYALFSSDGKYVLINSDKNIFVIWDILNCAVVKRLKFPYNNLQLLAFSFEKKYIIYQSYSNSIVYYNFEEGSDKVLSDFNSPILSTALSQDGNYLVVYAYDKPLKLYDMNKFEFIRNLGKKIFNINNLYFMADGKSVIATCRDNKILISEIFNDKNIFIKVHNDYIISITCSQDGKYIISSGRDRSLKILDAQSKRLIKEFTGLTTPVYFLKISRDSKYFLSVNYEGEIKLWDLEKMCEISSYFGHNYLINSSEFSPDNKYFLSGSYDGTIRLWGMNLTKKEVVRYSVFLDDEWVAITPDGYFNVSSNGKIHIKNLKSDYYNDEEYYNMFYKPDIVRDRIKNLE